MSLLADLKQWFQDWAKRNRERKAGALEITLKDRLDACALLLTYIARNKIEIDLKDIVPKLVRARDADDAKRKLTEQEAEDFWSAYDQLTRKVAPVTSDSIKASAAFRRTASGIVRDWPGGKFLAWAFVSLVLLLVIQMYWLIGTSLIAEIDRLEGEENSALISLAVATKHGGTILTQLYSAKAQEATSAPARHCIGDPNKIDDDNIIVRYELVDRLLTEIRNDGTDSVNVTDAKPSSSNEGAPNAKAPLDLEAECIFAHQLRLWIVYNGLERWRDFRSHQQSAQALIRSHYSPDAVTVGNIESENARYLKASRLEVEILNIYILPLLYGFLGACTYVLRSLSLEVKAEIYSRRSDIRFYLRMLLGSIAGLSAAWFLASTTADTAEHKTVALLSPLALAFLAGYGVEIVFATMDRLIGAFVPSVEHSKNT
jgi:hypothetical protein